MRTQIVFQENYDRLPQGGTYESPAPVGHPPLKYRHDNGSFTSWLGGDTTVVVPKNERIQIWFEDAQQRTNVVMAPVRLVLGTWNSKNITLDQINGPDTPVTSSPSFSLNHEDEHGYVYNGANPNWQTDNIPAITRYMQGVEGGRDGSAETPRVHEPYVQFDFADYDGTLFYGVEFVVTVNGSVHGYYFFDPNIRVS